MARASLPRIPGEDGAKQRGDLKVDYACISATGAACKYPAETGKYKGPWVPLRVSEEFREKVSLFFLKPNFEADVGLPNAEEEKVDQAMKRFSGILHRPRFLVVSGHSLRVCLIETRVAADGGFGGESCREIRGAGIGSTR